MEQENVNYGKATVGIGTSMEREIPIKNFLRANFIDHRLCSVAELENNEGFIISVENPSSSGRSTSQKMFLSKQSLIGIHATLTLYFSCKGIDFLKELNESLTSETIQYETAGLGKSENDLVSKVFETNNKPQSNQYKRHRLTRKQKAVLSDMHLNKTDILCSSGKAFYGNQETSMKLVYGLLRLCLIKEDEFQGSIVQRYVITADGILALQNGFIDREW